MPVQCTSEVRNGCSALVGVTRARIEKRASSVLRAHIVSGPVPLRLLRAPEVFPAAASTR